MIYNFENLSNQKNFINSTVNYDHVIIGTGPAATVLVNYLIKNLKKVLVIERGNFNQKNYESVESIGLKIKEKSRTFIVGGTTSDWSHISSYFEDFEMKDKINGTKNLWPISHKELMKLYSQLDKRYKFDFKKKNLKRLKIPFNSRLFFSPKKPLNFKIFYKNNKFDLIYNCKVDLIDENNKIISLVLLNKKKKIIIKVKNLIICAGGLESNRIILKSLKKGFLKKLINKKYVGKYFMEHPKVYIGEIKYPKIELIKKVQMISNKNKIKYYGISLPSIFQKKNKLLNTYVRFEKKNNKISKILNLFSVKNDIFLVKAFFEMEPKYKNQINIYNNGNLIINLKIGQKEKKSINLLEKKILNFFSSKPNLENINYSKNKKYLADASHHIGGLVYPKIVDKNLKIIGTNNIFVCSSAVFPTSGSVNPTMTICALAVRLANYLVKK